MSLPATRADREKALERVDRELQASQGRDQSQLRIQRATLLMLLGRKAEAIDEYRTAAFDLADRGHGLRAISVAKLIQRADAASSADISDEVSRRIKRADEALAAREAEAAAEAVVDQLVAETRRAAPKRRAPTRTNRIDELLAGLKAPAPPPGPPARPPVLPGLLREELASFIDGFKRTTYRAGKVIVKEGDPGDSLFVLASGTARTFVRGKQTDEMTEGAFFGEVAFLTRQPRNATIKAATDCDVLELDRATLESIVRQHRNVWKVLTEHALRRIENIIRHNEPA